MPETENTSNAAKGNEIVGEFDLKVQGTDLLVKPAGAVSGYNGDFEVNPQIAEAAKQLARDIKGLESEGAIVPLEQDEFWKDAASLDGEKGISENELAAYAIARSMAHDAKVAQPNQFGNGKLIFGYDGKIENGVLPSTTDDYSADPKLVALVAKEVWGDSKTLNENAKGDNAVDNKKFVAEASKILGITDPTTLPRHQGDSLDIPKC